MDSLPRHYLAIAVGDLCGMFQRAYLDRPEAGCISPSYRYPPSALVCATDVRSVFERWALKAQLRKVKSGYIDVVSFSVIVCQILRCKGKGRSRTQRGEAGWMAPVNGGTHGSTAAFPVDKKVIERVLMFVGCNAVSATVATTRIEAALADMPDYIRHGGLPWRSRARCFLMGDVLLCCSKHELKSVSHRLCVMFQGVLNNFHSESEKLRRVPQSLEVHLFACGGRFNSRTDSIFDVVSEVKMFAAASRSRQQHLDRLAFKVVVGAPSSSGVLSIGSDPLDSVASYLAPPTFALDDTNSVVSECGDHVGGMAFSPCSKLLLILGGETMCMWRVNEGKVVWKACEPVGLLICSYYPDGTAVAIATGAFAVRVRNAMTGAVLYTLEGHDDVVTCISVCGRPCNDTVHDDGRTGRNWQRLLTGSRDGTWKVWNAKTGSLYHTHANPDQFVADGHFTNGSEANGTGYPPPPWHRREEPIRCCSFPNFSATGNVWTPPVTNGSGCAVLGIGNNLCVVTGTDVQSWNSFVSRRRLVGHSGPITSCVFSRSNEVIASSSEDWTVRVWDARQALTKWSEPPNSISHINALCCLSTFHGHVRPVMSCAFMGGARCLVSAGADGCLFVWKHPSMCPEQEATIGYEARRAFVEEGERRPKGVLLDYKRGVRKGRVPTNLFKSAKVICMAVVGRSDSRMIMCVAPDGSRCVTSQPGGAVSSWKLP